MPLNEDFNAGERGLQITFERVPDGLSVVFGYWRVGLKMLMLPPL
jgi:hypothetical protein